MKNKKISSFLFKNDFDNFDNIKLLYIYCNNYKKIYNKQIYNGIKSICKLKSYNKNLNLKSIIENEYFLYINNQKHLIDNQIVKKIENYIFNEIIYISKLMLYNKLILHINNCITYKKIEKNLDVLDTCIIK
jgi:hypothetical protein